MDGLANGRARVKKAALYARVSTTDQAGGLDTQLQALRQYAAARTFQAIESIDEGISGTQASRPALDALLLAARARKIDVVVTTKLDRLFRSVRHLVTLIAEFQSLGVDLVVLDQAIDTTTPTGRLTFHVLAAIAEFERDLIRERVIAGLAAAKGRGQKLGRPKATGIDPDHIADLRREGLGFRAIASRISSLLGKRVHKNTVRAVWRDVQRLNQLRRPHPG